MKYVQRSLADGEVIIVEARFHWFYTFGYLAVLALGVTVALFISVTAYAAFGVALFILCVLVYLRGMIIKWTTEIALTNRRFIYKWGWIARHTQELSLRKIEEVNLRQSVLGRILGYGKLLISGTGGDKPIELPNVDEPLALKKALANATDVVGG